MLRNLARLEPITVNKQHVSYPFPWCRMRLEGKLRVVVIFIVVVVCSGILLVLICIRDSIPLGNQIPVDWVIMLTGIFLEVFGISLFLDWLIDFGRKRRLEPRRQIALQRLFTAVGRDLFLPLARINTTNAPLTEKEDQRLSAKGMVTPSTNLPMHKYILHVAAATRLGSKGIERLIDRFGDLFGIEFVNDLFQLGDTAYHIVQEGVFIGYHVMPREDEAEKIEIAERVNERVDPLRLKLMTACTDFIVKRIYPQSPTGLKDKIRWHLLNFYVGYNPEICDLVLEGKRMKVSI